MYLEGMIIFNWNKIIEMAKIIFDIKWGGEPISNFERSVKEIATLQHFRRKYRFDIIESIELDDDFTITIDIKDLSQKIDWKSLTLPNEKVRQIIRDLEHYQDLSEQLDKILGDLHSKNFDKRNEIGQLGVRAIDIISSFIPGEHFNNFLGNKGVSIQEIQHTLNKEVDILTSYVRDKDSQKRKNEALNDAVRHLKRDIQGFKIGLDHIELN